MAAVDICALDLIEVIRRWSGPVSGHRTAFRFLRDGERDAVTLSFADLDARARAIAVRLRQVASSGERVLIVSPPGLDYISGLVGCLYAGLVAVPAYPATFGGADRDTSRLATIISQSQASAVCLTDDLKALGDRLIGTGVLAAEALIQTEQVPLEFSDSWTKPTVAAHTLAILQYTSGSTAQPKGVMLTHRNLLTNIAASTRIYGVTEETTFVGWLPPYHDMGLIGGILAPLVAGAQSILMSPQAFLDRPVRWLEGIAHYRGEISGAPNFAYDLCVRRTSDAERKRLDLTSWRVASNGAEPVRPATLERFACAFAPAGFRPHVLRPAYGLAESTLLVSIGTFRGESAIRRLDAAGIEQGLVRESNEATALAYVACGQPVEEAAIVDPVSGERCDSARVGEIWLRGDSVAQGYWGRSAETAETFGAQLANEDDRGGWLRTGDLGFLDEGELFIVGRRKDVLIVAGRNIHPHDLEATAQASHRGLRVGCGAAFQVPGDEMERIVLMQEISPDLAGDRQEAARAAICEAIARQHNVHIDEIVFIAPRTLPKTTSGKIRRAAARAAFLAQTLSRFAPKDFDGGQKQVDSDPSEARRRLADQLHMSSADAPSGVAAPRASGDVVLLSDLEKDLAAIWADVLGLATGTLRGSSSFFDLGGDSLKATAMVARVHERYGVDLPISALFESPTMTLVARLIEQRRASRLGVEGSDSELEEGVV